MTIVRLLPVISFDERLGRLLRLIRHRADLTQEDLARQSGVPVRDIRSIESGSAGIVKVDRVRSAFSAVGAQARLTAWWNGASADRLLDEKHAALTERATVLYQARGWTTAVEVTYSEYGDRGSIDLLAAFEPLRAVAVNEVKSALGSLEDEPPARRQGAVGGEDRAEAIRLAPTAGRSRPDRS